MSGQQIAFWIFAVLSVLTALGVVLHRNPTRSALLLVVNFITLALLYLTLNAQLLAMLQVLVYAGAIMVLFIFVIMLLNLGGELAKSDPLTGQGFFGIVLGLAMLGGLGFAIVRFGSAIVPISQRMVDADKAKISQIQVIGWDLFTRYVYPFELTSFLLLVGAIGVILLTRRRAGAGTPHGSA